MAAAQNPQPAAPNPLLAPITPHELAHTPVEPAWKNEGDRPNYLIDCDVTDARMCYLSRKRVRHFASKLMEAVLKAHACSHWFDTPVDVSQFPTYMDFVKRPMCIDDLHRALRAIEGRGRGGWGSEKGPRTLRDLLAGLNQVWINAHAFNPPDSDVVFVATVMGKRAASWWAREAPKVFRMRCDYIEAESDQEVTENIYCVVCGSGDDRPPNNILLCGSELHNTGCGRAFHQKCPGGVGDFIPPGDWYCDECVALGVPSVARTSIPVEPKEAFLVPLAATLYPKAPGAKVEQPLHLYNSGFHGYAPYTEVGALGTERQFDRATKSGFPGMRGGTTRERVEDVFRSRAGLAFRLDPGTPLPPSPSDRLSPAQDCALVASTMALRSITLLGLLTSCVASSGPKAACNPRQLAELQGSLPRQAAADSERALLWCAYTASRSMKSLWVHGAFGPAALASRLRKLLTLAVFELLENMLDTHYQARALRGATSCELVSIVMAHHKSSATPVTVDTAQAAIRAVQRAVTSHTNPQLAPLDLQSLAEVIPHMGVLEGGSGAPPSSKRAAFESGAASGPAVAAGVLASQVHRTLATVSGVQASNPAFLPSFLPLAGDAATRQAGTRAWLRARGVDLGMVAPHAWDAVGTFTGVAVAPAVFHEGGAPAKNFATPMVASALDRHARLLRFLKAGNPRQELDDQEGEVFAAGVDKLYQMGNPDKPKKG